MKSHEKHRLKARSKLRIAVITVSTSRYYAASEDRGIKDESGDLICRLARKAGHVIIYRSLVSDFKPDIRQDPRSYEIPGGRDRIDWWNWRVPHRCHHRGVTTHARQGVTRIRRSVQVGKQEAGGLCFNAVTFTPRNDEHRRNRMPAGFTRWS